MLLVDAIAGKISSNVRVWEKLLPSREDLRNLVEDVSTEPETPPQDPNAGVPTTSPMEAPSEPPFPEQPIYETPIYYSPSSPEFKRADFEMLCRDTLLSDGSTWDELISQTDYAAFLNTYCISESTCNPDKPLVFQMLSTSLQAAFTDPLCSADEDMCHVDSEEDFGYVYNKDTKFVVKGQIRNMCDSLFPLVGSYIAPTSGTSPASIARQNVQHARHRKTNLARFSAIRYQSTSSVRVTGVPGSKIAGVRAAQSASVRAAQVASVRTTQSASVRWTSGHAQTYHGPSQSNRGPRKPRV